MTAQTATYKGRTYRLLWSGQTKYGRRAKLGFFDGTKEFWVDESRVQVLSGGSSRSGGRGRSRRSGYCEECGEYFSGAKVCWETGMHCYAD